MTNDNTKNNYAYEIRFVDNNVVQVFDLAAKRKQDTTKNAILPLEYKEDEVVKGQIRYSKLVGSEPSTTDRDVFGYEDSNEPYKHHIATKISKNRKSTQRNTFFMMGGGGGGGGGNDHRRYDSGTDFTPEEDEPVDDYYYHHQQNDDIPIDENQNDMVLPSSPKFVQGPASFTAESNPNIIMNLPEQQSQQLRMNLPEQQPQQLRTNLPQQQPQQQRMNIPPISQNTIAISIPQQAHIPTIYDNYRHSQQFTIDHQDASSEKYMQQSMTTHNNKKSRGCCCIIS